MKWFKFYGQDYLSDPKMLSLTSEERSCWITLLAYSSVNDNGKVTFLSPSQLLFQAGLSPQDECWDRTLTVLEKFEKLEMITIDNGVITVKNWEKRQETNLTSYERVKRFRLKKQNDNAKITLEENRIEENRIEDKRICVSIPFNKFWEIYPKKTGKKKTEEYWNKLSLEVQNKILEDIPKRMNDDKWVNKFIKDPERYIKYEQWNDEIIIKQVKTDDLKVATGKYNNIKIIKDDSKKI